MDSKLGLVGAASNFIAEKCTKGGLVGFYGVGKPGNPDYTEAVGTGFLLRICDEVYCVTARHVLEPESHFDGRVGLSFSCSRMGDAPLMVQKEQFSQAHTSHRDDIAAFRLLPVQVAEIKRIGKIAPFELSDFVIRENLGAENGGYFVTGFPDSEAQTDEFRRRVDAKMLIYFTAVADTAPTSYQGFDHLRDIGVHFQVDGNIGHEGQITPSPWPRGASGGPLWAYWEDDSSGIVRQRSGIVGLCRRFEPADNMIVATDSKVVLECLASKWSALGEVFDKEFGPWQF